MKIVGVFKYLAIALLVSGTARADEDEKLVAARAHNSRAEAAYALGRYEEAAKEYEAVFELVPQAALLYNAAQAHRLGGNNQRALLLYKSYLRVYGATIPNRGEVEGHIANVQAALDGAQRAVNAQPTAPAPTRPLSDAPPAATPLPAAPAQPTEPPRSNTKIIVAVVIAAVVLVAAGVTLGVVLGGSSQADPMASLGDVHFALGAW